MKDIGHSNMPSKRLVYALALFWGAVEGKVGGPTNKLYVLLNIFVSKCKLIALFNTHIEFSFTLYYSL